MRFGLDGQLARSVPIPAGFESTEGDEIGPGGLAVVQIGESQLHRKTGILSWPGKKLSAVVGKREREGQKKRMIGLASLLNVAGSNLWIARFDQASELPPGLRIIARGSCLQKGAGERHILIGHELGEVNVRHDVPGQVAERLAIKPIPQF
jgi:hypothetical protein